ncbi:MAG: M48 family metalloprotease [Pseudolabrys sp.]
MAAYGLYTHIQSNRRRSVALLIGLFALVYVMVFAGALLAEALTVRAPLDYLMRAAVYDWMKAAPWATVGAFVWIFIAYKFHQSMIDTVTGAHPVTRQEEPRLYNLLENLCISRGITMPTLRIADDSALNAFATGLNDKQYSITVTRGLMERLNDAELEAVLGHELTHIRNGDVRMMVIAMVIAGVVSFFGEMVFRLFFQATFFGGFGGRRRRGDGEGGGNGAIIAIVIAIALIVVSWLLSVVIRFALSRRREFLADAGSVELTKDPDAMISALRKIENRGDLHAATSAVMEMCVDNPRTDFSDLFATHPSIDARVEALVRYAGGHDPGPLSLPEPDEQGQIGEKQYGGPWGDTAQDDGGQQAPTGTRQGPWGPLPGIPGLPGIPPGSPGQPSSDRGGPHGGDHGSVPDVPLPPAGDGPWGPRRS